RLRCSSPPSSLPPRLCVEQFGCPPPCREFCSPAVQRCSFLFLLPFEVPTRRRVLRHDRTVLAGQRVKLRTATRARRFDGVAVLVVLPEITEENTLAAGRAGWSATSEIRLTFVRATNLFFEHLGVTPGQIRCEGKACHGSAFVSIGCI